MKRRRLYETEQFKQWLRGLRDRQARARVQSRIQRLLDGNAGDTVAVGEGVFELRIHYGPGYRVYYKEFGTIVVFILAGGDKSSQPRDIQLALTLAREAMKE